MMLLRLLVVFFVFTVFTAQNSFAKLERPYLLLDSDKHISGITSFNVDGHKLISAGADKVVRIWDMKTQTLVKKIRGQVGSGNAGAIVSTALSPDGKWLAVAGNPGSWGVRILDYASGEIVRTLPFKSKNIPDALNGISTLSFSDDSSRLMFVEAAGSVRVWDINSATLIFKTRRKSDFNISSADLSPDGKKVVMFAMDGEAKSFLQIWDVDSGKLKTKVKVDGQVFGQLLFFSDSERFAATELMKNKISIFDVDDGSEIRTLFSGNSGYMSMGLNFSPDRSLIVFAQMHRDTRKTEAIHIMNAETGDILAATDSIDDAVSRVALTEDNKTLAAGTQSGEMYFWNFADGNLSLLSAKKHNIVNTVAFARDGQSIAWGYGHELTHAAELSNLVPHKTKAIDSKYLRETHTAQGVKIFKKPLGGGFNLLMMETVKEEKALQQPHPLATQTLTHDGKKIYLGSHFFTPIYSYAFSRPPSDSRELMFSEKWHLLGHFGPVVSLSASPNDHLLVSGSMDGTVRLWDTKEDKLLASIYVAPDNEWVVWTPEGYFNSSENGAKLFGWHVNQGVDKLAKFYPASQLFDDYYRPDLVQAKLQGKFSEMIAHEPVKVNIEDVLATGSAPTVEFVSPRNSQLDKRDIEAIISLTDQGGGIGKLVWKINGVTIGVAEADRGIALNQKEVTDTVKASRLLTLSPGKNRIEVTAYNAEGKIASEPAVLNVTLKDAISERPSLHILAVGINKYRDKSLWLNYAVPDAQSLGQSINAAGRSIFADIHITEVYDQQANMTGIEQAFKSIGKKARSHDVFVLYLAGHGITQDGKYHFLPADFRFRNEDSIRQSAVTQDHLQSWMSQVQAQKSLVLLDTCNSGSFVQAQAVTRGVAEKTAIVKLTRATGRATIAASTDSQVALEGYEGHGVFTYALLKAMTEADRKNGNRDGVTSTAEIASYIDNVVPDLTYNKWGYEQVPQVNLHGREFPIGVTQ